MSDKILQQAIDTLEGYNLNGFHSKLISALKAQLATCETQNTVHKYISEQSSGSKAQLEPCDNAALESIICIASGKFLSQDCDVIYVEKGKAQAIRKALTNTGNAGDVDYGALKKSAKTLEDAPDEYEWERGWNDCIDHLHQQGYLKTP